MDGKFIQKLDIVQILSKKIKKREKINSLVYFSREYILLPKLVH